MGECPPQSAVGAGCVSASPKSFKHAGRHCAGRPACGCGSAGGNSLGWEVSAEAREAAARHLDAQRAGIVRQCRAAANLAVCRGRVAAWQRRERARAAREPSPES